jgi:hypothetical protein
MRVGIEKKIEREGPSARAHSLHQPSQLEGPKLNERGTTLEYFFFIIQKYVLLLRNHFNNGLKEPHT